MITTKRLREGESSLRVAVHALVVSVSSIGKLFTVKVAFDRAEDKWLRK